MRIKVNPRGSSAVGLLLLAATVSAIAQQPKADAQFNPPDEASVPSGPLGDSIRLGKLLATETGSRLPGYVGNALRCTSCHLDGGRT